MRGRFDPEAATLTEPVVRHAIVDPDHPALSMGDRDMTYAELDRHSNAVARFLRETGVERGDRVGLFAHKSIELFVALIGIMKAGAAYVPINPDAPTSYVRHILGECGIRHVVTGRTRVKRCLAAAAGTDVEVVLGAESETLGPRVAAWSEVWEAGADPLPDAPDADDLAYIIFTSGSTGRPKGIMHSHRTGLAYARVAAEAYGFLSSDRITNHAPLNFDLSTLELFGGTLAGATIVIVPETHARLPASFSQLLENQRVTIINAVPFALVQLLHRGALDDRDLSAVRWVLFGGEVFPTRDLRRLMARLPTARFANVYGPAEVNGVTYHIVPELPADTDEPISIGRLYPGMKSMVIDAEDRELPVGTVGELLISSPTHMLGYWNQPEMTESSRLKVRTHEGAGEVYYRTGDLVAQRADGSFTLHGRKDRQIKARGHRIELDEIETAMMQHPAVEQAVVYVVPDGHGSNEIRAAVTLLDNATPAPDEGTLVGHLRELLPRYAVPAVVEIATSVPRTLTGKADRVALVEAAFQADLAGEGGE